MKKGLLVLTGVTGLLLNGCASVEEVKNVKEISSVPVNKKDYFKIGKVNPFTPPILSLKKKQVSVKAVNVPLPVIMEGVCSQAKINCDKTSWEDLTVPVTVNYRGDLYGFLNLLEKEYSLKFSYDGKTLRLYDYDQFKVEKAQNEFYSKLYGIILPKVSVSFKDAPVKNVFDVLTLSSGWTVTADSTIDLSKVDETFTFNGREVPLKDVLDAISTKYGWVYRIKPENREIVFSATVTKVYRIPVLPEKQDYTYTVGVKSSDGNSKVTKKVKVSEDFWKNLEKSLKSYLSRNGKLFISPETGVVSVTDSPKVIAQIDRVMENTIRSALSQVSFRVAVYEVTLTRNISTGINWSTIFSGAKVTLNANGATSYVLNWGGTGSIADNPFTYLVKALENYGKVKVLYDNYVKTESGKQVSIYPTYDYRYVSKVTVNYLDNGQISTEPEFDSMTLGLQVSIVPKRINPEEVAFDFVVANTSLVKEETYNFSGSSFTNPKLVANNKISFSSILRRGQLEVLTGWRGYKVEDESTGIPLVSEIPGVGLAFKGKNRKAEITEFVIAVYVY